MYNNIMTENPLDLEFHLYPIALLDYTFVIIFYVSLSLILAVIFDGYIVPPYNKEKEMKDNSFILGLKIFIHLAIQGFIAIILITLAQKIPSPFHNVLGYDTACPLGKIIRNPAIISVILFALSQSLRGRLFLFFSRFNKNFKI
jgi:hypothetical protein